MAPLAPERRFRLLRGEHGVEPRMDGPPSSADALPRAFVLLHRPLSAVWGAVPLWCGGRPDRRCHPPRHQGGHRAGAAGFAAGPSPHVAHAARRVRRRLRNRRRDVFLYGGHVGRSRDHRPRSSGRHSSDSRFAILCRCFRSPYLPTIRQTRWSNERRRRAAHSSHVPFAHQSV